MKEANTHLSSRRNLVRDRPSLRRLNGRSHHGGRSDPESRHDWGVRRPEASAISSGPGYLSSARGPLVLLNYHRKSRAGNEISSALSSHPYQVLCRCGGQRRRSHRPVWLRQRDNAPRNHWEKLLRMERILQRKIALFIRLLIGLLHLRRPR